MKIAFALVALLALFVFILALAIFICAAITFLEGMFDELTDRDYLNEIEHAIFRLEVELDEMGRKFARKINERRNL